MNFVRRPKLNFGVCKHPKAISKWKRCFITFWNLLFLERKKTQQLHILSTKKEQDLYIFTLCDFAITWVFWDSPWTRNLGIPCAIWTKNLALDWSHKSYEYLPTLHIKEVNSSPYSICINWLWKNCTSENRSTICTSSVYASLHHCISHFL